MIRGTLAVTLALGGLAAAVGCSGESIVIGGDPNQTAGGGPPATGGVFTTGGSTSGGAFPEGGAFSTGGSGFGATGGSFYPTGGTTGVNGGSSTIPTQGGTGGTGIAEGGEGGVLDPYPRVYWDEGQGYRTACPQWGDYWGFTCWNWSGGNSYACMFMEGPSYCNACSCAVPCETSDDCPAALTGQRAVCLSSTTNVPSCFVLCEERTHCPTGMECSIHPGTGERVCVWWTDRVE